MSNKLSKNAEKSGEGLVVVAASTLIANAIQQQGLINQEMQPYAVTVISGVVFGLANFIKHTIQSAVAKRRARAAKE